jgi:uncharacterized protein (TIGR03083 family)
MEVAAHIAALDREGRMLVDAARSADLDAPVPTCRGWRQLDLLAHVGFVHRWATRYVATAVTEMVDEPDEAGILKGAPPEDDRCDWVSQGHAALVRALRAAPADLVCWTFLAAPSPLAMWARRQAHETAVHRVDAELAAGLAPAPVDAALAADGIDELLFAFLGRPSRRRDDTPTGTTTFRFEASDTRDSDTRDSDTRDGADRADRSRDSDTRDSDTRASGRWTVRVSDGVVDAHRGPGRTDFVVRGTASDLYLLLWHRRALEGLETDVPEGLFEQVWGAQGVTWA